MLYRYLSEKDLFEELYRRGLQKRLLNGSSEVFEADVLNKLKACVL